MMDKLPNNNNLVKADGGNKAEKPNAEIKSLIYNIRGQQVMLDSDLAKLYRCKNGTKEINQAVKNNPEKFPERFSWKLSDEEFDNFLVKNFYQKTETRGGRYKNPRVFTEQGVMMLATILKTSIATKTTIRIMDAFVIMKKYISSSFLEQNHYKDMLLEDHTRIRALEESFNAFTSKQKDEGIYFDGHIYDAYSRILEIFSEAKESLTIIDAYTDIITLNIVKRLSIPVTIITSKSAPLKSQDIKKYQEQYNNLTIVYDNTFHDRYFVLDNKVVYHCGASINRIGYKTFSITKIGDQEIVVALLSKIASK